MFKDVFISHAKEDYEIAEKLYNYLLKKEYSPWLDKKKLKVGQNWDYEIKKALRESTFVILLLSSTSVKKRGYVQKEFKYAIEYSENKLIDDIYIIPILLDKCEVPEPLIKFQWTEISNENFEKIFESLNLQRQRYLNDLSPDLIEINDYSSLFIDLKIDISNKINYSCDLPSFHENNFFDSHFVNTFICQKVYANISEKRKWIHVDNVFRAKENSFYLEISHAIRRLNKNFLSLSIFYNSYFGGAYPNTNLDTLNIAFNPERVLNLREVVKYKNLNEFIEECLLKYGNKEQRIALGKYIKYLSEDNINFVFDDKMLEINFTNQIPRVILALGILEIPMKDLSRLV